MLPTNGYYSEKMPLFICNRISEIDARDGEIDAPNATSDDAARAAALAKPENGYCRLFGS